LKTKEYRHPEQARPAMEACGIDVFSTVRKAGLPIEVVSDPAAVSELLWADFGELGFVWVSTSVQKTTTKLQPKDAINTNNEIFTIP
jgi:hypothetical protein